MRVIAVRRVKRRKLANSGVDLVGPFGVVARINVRLRRPKGNRRKPHLLRVNGLTANDDDLGIIRDLAGRADDMFELNTIHRLSGARPP